MVAFTGTAGVSPAHPRCAVAVDGTSAASDEQLIQYVTQFVSERMQASEFHPDGWRPIVLHDPAEIEKRLMAVVGDKYSYREMDEFTDLMERTLKGIPSVAKVERKGLLEETVHLHYSQERLASYSKSPSKLSDLLSARNITTPGGQINVEGKNVTINPSGEFKSEKEIGDVVVPLDTSGPPVYLRDLVDITRSYESPPRYVNFFSWRDDQGLAAESGYNAFGSDAFWSADRHVWP